MKAITFHEFGGPEVPQYEEVPQPVPGAGEVSVRVKACALNHVDLLVRRNRPGLPLPHIGGCDVAGVVAEVGAGVTAVEPGAAVVVNPALSCGHCRYCRAGEQSLCREFRILGRDVHGGMAEYVVIPAVNVYPLFPDFSFIEGAAAPLTFMTAWRLLMTRAQLRPGERIFIVGAGGGVATAAIQIAQLVGATVYVSTGGAEKVAQALELGVDEALDYTAVDVVDGVRALTQGVGVDVVLDSVGQATWDSSLRMLGKGGRLVTCGATTGPLAQMDIRYMWRKQLSVLGSTMANDREFRTVMGLVAAGKLHPRVDRVFPLRRAREAQAYLESEQQFGKVVLEV
jgi:NADPH:quinone reductase-like Zn-dependent oxidoreductase